MSTGNLAYLNRHLLRDIEIVYGDVRDAELLRRHLNGVNLVFHLAALVSVPFSFVTPRTYVDVNICGTLNVLESFRTTDAELFVFVSSSEIYGTSLYEPMDELHATTAKSPYAATKISGEKIVESYRYVHRIPAVILRPFNIFGPRQSSRAVIPSIVAQMVLLDGKVRIGATDSVRDFTYVEDTVDSLFRCIDSPKAVGAAINIGTGIGFEIAEVIKIVEGVLGITAIVHEDQSRIRPPKAEVSRLVCDSSLARRLIGWSPRVSFKEGISELSEFVRTNPDVYADCRRIAG